MLTGKRIDSTGCEDKRKAVRDLAVVQFNRDTLVLGGSVPQNADTMIALRRGSFNAADRTIPKA